MTLTADHPAAGSLAIAPNGRVAWQAIPMLTVGPVSGADWDRISTNFDGISQEQLDVFAHSRWPSVRHEAQLFHLDGKLVGGVLMMVQKLPLGVGAIAVSKWGPVLKDEHRPDAEAIYAGMIEALIAEYAVKRRQMLSVLPRAALDAGNPGFAYLRQRGFKVSSELLFPNRYIINLRLSDEEQRKSFDQKWRYHLNKSEKQGLSFEHATADQLPEFDVLYSAMTDRKKFPDHSAYETVPALMAIEDPALRPELFFVRHSGEIVAGAIIFKAGDRAVYLYGATNEQALPLRAGYFLHWHVIRWLRDNTRAGWYDLGGTDGFQGLHQFKKGMVGDAGVITPVPPVANYAASTMAYALGMGAFAARDGLHALRRRIDALRGNKARPNQIRDGEVQ
ncbi:MAG TPA: GNAT family N-acetyltransferase [Devosiaceae bacterium]|jgi:hypothetical protein